MQVPQMQPFRHHARGSWPVRLVGLLCALLCMPQGTWAQNVTLEQAKLQDNCLPSKRLLDVVISRYQEDVNNINSFVTELLAHKAIAPLRPCIILYVKGGSPEDIAKQAMVGIVRWLPNVGRESHTYLHYMVHHHGAYPDHVMFLQGAIEERHTLLRKLDVFTHATGYMCLGWWGRSTCDGGEHQRDVRMREVWAMTRRTFCFQDFDICYRGQFIISAHRLMLQPVDVYRYLFQYIAPPAHHEIYQDLQRWVRPLPNGPGPDNPNNPLLGFTMERAWTFMFNAHGHTQHGEPEHARVCNKHCECFGKDSGSVAPVQCTPEQLQGACQCLDHVHSDVHAVHSALTLV